MSTLLIPPTQIMAGVSAASTSTSTPVHIMYSDLVSIQIVWTGTPTGAFTVNVSNTASLNSQGVISGGTWSALAATHYEVTGAYPSAAGGAGNAIIQFVNLGFAFIELVYTAASGTGLITATLTAKPL